MGNDNSPSTDSTIGIQYTSHDPPASMRRTKTHTFPVRLTNVTKTNITIAEPSNVRADQLTLTTWTASTVLANILYNFSLHTTLANHANSDSSVPPVLELGAGTGLVGITAAAVHGTKVVLSDLAPIVPALQANASLNRDLLAERNGACVAGELDWTSPSTLIIHSADGTESTHDAADGKVKLILAADTIYDPAHPSLLTNVISTWLEKTRDAKVLICYPLRVAYLDEIRELWERLGGIGLECFHEEKAVAEDREHENWDDERVCEWSVWGWKREVLGEAASIERVFEDGRPNLEGSYERILKIATW